MLDYKYNAKEELSKLVTGYRYLTQVIPQSILIECLKICTNQLEIIFRQLGNLKDSKNLITSIVKRGITLPQLEELVDNFVKEEKSIVSDHHPQTELLSKFSLLSSTKKQQITKAVEILYNFYSKNHDSVKSCLHSVLSEEEQQDSILNQLIPNISTILRMHISMLSTNINLQFLGQNDTLPKEKVDKTITMF